MSSIATVMTSFFVGGFSIGYIVGWVMCFKHDEREFKKLIIGWEDEVKGYRNIVKDGRKRGELKWLELQGSGWGMPNE